MSMAILICRSIRGLLFRQGCSPAEHPAILRLSPGPEPQLFPEPERYKGASFLKTTGIRHKMLQVFDFSVIFKVQYSCHATT
jgi:hypothetical protein